MNKTCPNCQKESQGDYLYCPYCGYQLDDSDVLYHYTSIDTLTAILNNVEHTFPPKAPSDSLEYYKIKLRATQWAFFNDPLEYRYLLSKINEFFNMDDDLRQYKDAFNEALLYASGFSGVPYIISLSKSRDNLDMWRSYSRNGAGVAIGFKAKELSECVGKMSGLFSFVRLYECRYLNDNLIFDEIKYRLKRYFMDLFSASQINLGALGPLLSEFTVFKHPCYMNECEKRIVIFDDTPRASSSKFRSSNGVMIPYIEIELPLSTINEIVIGPCADKDLNSLGIKMRLDSLTHLKTGITVESSELPYRQV